MADNHNVPEKKEFKPNDPASCSRACLYRGTGKCSFESCPYDEYPVNYGGTTTDVCVVCGATITRSQLDHGPIMCELCLDKLRFILEDSNFATLMCLISTGGYEGYCK